MAELKKVMFERIQKSGRTSSYLNNTVQLINHTFWSFIYETDDNKGLCEDGDFKVCRYINHDNGGKVFKR